MFNVSFAQDSSTAIFGPCLIEDGKQGEERGEEKLRTLRDGFYGWQDVSEMAPGQTRGMRTIFVLIFFEPEEVGSGWTGIRRMKRRTRGHTVEGPTMGESGCRSSHARFWIVATRFESPDFPRKIALNYAMRRIARP
jgi:hypothetical protein